MQILIYVEADLIDILDEDLIVNISKIKKLNSCHKPFRDKLEHKNAKMDYDIVSVLLG